MRTLVRIFFVQYDIQVVLYLLLSGKISLKHRDTVFFRLKFLRGLYEYNNPSDKELSIFTGQLSLPKGKQKYDITTCSYACIAPVGGHTCLTAGERSEPAVVDYKRMNVSVPVGGPTTTNDSCPNREVRGKQQDKFNNL